MALAICLSGTGWARAADFTAALNRDSITLGEQATLSLTFSGGEVRNVPGFNVDGLRIVQNGSSQSSTIVNGVVNSSITVLYSVTPQREGEFTIPALTTEVNGQRLATEPLHLTVAKAAAPTADAIHSGTQVAFMKLIVPQAKVYAGQSLVVQLQIYLRDDVQNFANFQFTAMPADGFVIGKMTQAPQQSDRVGDHSYRIVPLNVALTAKRAGDLAIGPFAASAIVVLPSANQSGGDPFFRQFFNQGEQRQVALTTETAAIHSQPLPTENVPADFNGAIGDFKLAASAGPTNLAVGDPITLRVQVSGHGALDTVTLPDLSAWNGFKSFPPTTKVDLTGPLELDGTKTFEQIFTPQNSDIRELPPVSFSFFNPADGKYHTLTQPATPLVVRAAGATPLPVIAGAAETKPAPPDILPIKEKLGTLVPPSAPLVARPLFLMMQSVPVLAFLAVFVWRKRTDALANNPRLRRRLAVEKLVQGGLADLRGFAAANQPDEFFAMLFRLLQEQLGERLDCPASAITEEIVDGHPLLRNAPAALREALHAQFQLCNQARYAPVRGTAELNSVATQFEQIIRQIREVRT